jgi:hypothetical protein
MMDLRETVISAMRTHAALRRVRLIGSRAEGRATELSDWDFAVETDDFRALAPALPRLLAPLDPLSQQWDRLSERFCWMLMLRGPVKVDLIFIDEPHVQEPPWVSVAENLGGIEAHFWDWMLWLRNKKAKAENGTVARELQTLFDHLLAPLGVVTVPSSIGEAVASYRSARNKAETRFGRSVNRELEAEVAPALVGW